MILDEYVKVEWKTRSRKQYEDLGYKFTNYGDIFYVKIEDMPKGSHYKINYKCDNCEFEGTMCYRDYIKSLVNGKKYCRSCSAKLLASTKRNQKYLENGVRENFYDYIVNKFSEDYFNEIWDYEKNTINPREIFASSISKVWIKCSNKEHGSYETTTNAFHRGRRCPYCRGLKVCEVNSLSYQYEKSNKLWSDKNKDNPSDYVSHSNKIVWWKCENNKHEDFKRQISRSVKVDFRCPCCVQELDCSLLQNAVSDYLTNNLGYSVNHEFGCKLVPINPLTDRKLPFDNEVIDLKLIIEVHGKQHYEVTGFHYQQAKVNNTTPQEQLDYQKWKDKFKRNYALEHGYFYLEIPYTSYENATYKKMIDEKINEIISSYEVKYD